MLLTVIRLCLSANLAILSSLWNGLRPLNTSILSVMEEVPLGEKCVTMYIYFYILDILPNFLFAIDV